MISDLSVVPELILRVGAGAGAILVEELQIPMIDQFKTLDFCSNPEHHS